MSGSQAVCAAGREFVTSDGVRLHYLEAGKGKPIVFVPGWRMPGSIFQRQLDFFGTAHRVLALDPRGHAESEPTAEGHYRQRRACDMKELLDAASVDSAVLVCWSMAIPEVLTYVQEHGTDRVRALVLVDWPYRIPGWLQEAAGTLALQYLRDPATVARDLLPTFFTIPQPEAWLAEITRASLRMPTSAAVAVLADYIVEGGDWTETLQALDRPLLYAVSPVFAEDAEHLRELVPVATIRVFDGAAHGFFVDRFEEFNEVLGGFVEGLR